jgi:large subunit ribosomal protein L2
MNPVDHPMGGGEGKTSGGKNPVSPWNKLSKGGKTLKSKKIKNNFRKLNNRKGTKLKIKNS